MALPSAVTIGSLALVVTAGVGLVVVAASAREDTRAPAAASADPSSAEPTHSADRQPTRPRQHDAADVVPKTLVEVYNNSGISGLAADKAAFLQGAGWNVASTDNWYGDIPVNTVYYPPKLRQQAQQLAAILHIGRLHRAVSPMQFDRLTVILTSA